MIRQPNVWYEQGCLEGQFVIINAEILAIVEVASSKLAAPTKFLVGRGKAESMALAGAGI